MADDLGLAMGLANDDRLMKLSTSGFFPVHTTKNSSSVKGHVHKVTVGVRLHLNLVNRQAEVLSKTH